MFNRKIVRFSWAMVLASCVVGGCRCSRDDSDASDAQIDRQTLVEEAPHAPRPHVIFPAGVHGGDASLNAFVEHVLQVCQMGDYDAFRQLFGSIYEPTSLANFRRIWPQVKEIEIQRIHAGEGDPPAVYVVEAQARLRQEDRKGRKEVNLPIMIFREGDHWRLGPVPKEFRDRVGLTSTAPSTGQETDSGQ